MSSISFVKCRQGLRILTLTLAAVACGSDAFASSFYVRDSLRDANVRAIEATAATATVRNAVSARLKDEVVRDEKLASFILQPRLVKTNGIYVLTVEKLRGSETVFAAQSRLNSLDDLERAANVATNAAIDQRSSSASVATGGPLRQQQAPLVSVSAAPAAPYSGTIAGAATGAADASAPAPLASSANAPRQPSPAKREKDGATSQTTSATAVEVIPTKQTKATQWMVGFGPFISRNLKSDRAMYDIMAGHKWNVNPKVSINAILEAAYSSERDQAKVYNFAVGGNYYVPGDDDTAPFATVDIGYGMASDANGNKGDGVSFGTGIGFEFFRTTGTNLDLLLRYSMIFDDTTPQSGLPAVIGLRIGMNF